MYKWMKVDEEVSHLNETDDAIGNKRRRHYSNDKVMYITAQRCFDAAYVRRVTARTPVLAIARAAASVVVITDLPNTKSEAGWTM